MTTPTSIPYGRQSVSEEDVAAVVEVLRSDWLTQGPVVPAFETALAAHCCARHGVAVNSATSALHIACLALGLGAGDVAWTVSNTFVASANCARYCGADVDFVDIDPHTFCLSAEALAAKLALHKQTGKRLPKLVIAVHFAGLSCDMQAIAALAKEYGFRIIEDASHAAGARYSGEPVGNCRYSDICVFSFHPVKIITTGEGGMATTNDTMLARRMERLRSHGITREPHEMVNATQGAWYYEQIELGLNYRMTDIQAALGLSQLARLDEFVSRRNIVAQRYDRAFSALPLTVQHVPDDICSARHLYVVRVAARVHAPLFDALRTAGIQVNLHYFPVHLQPYYQKLGFSRGHCPEAEAYFREAISLPIFPGLTDTEQARVIDVLSSAIFGLFAEAA